MSDLTEDEFKGAVREIFRTMSPGYRFPLHKRFSYLQEAIRNAADFANSGRWFCDDHPDLAYLDYWTDVDTHWIAGILSPWACLTESERTWIENRGGWDFFLDKPARA